jgi:uncharacterized protein (TIGR03437 family)
MRNQRALLGIGVLICAPALFGQGPVIGRNGIVNGASYSPVGLPNSAIAQGSMFIVFGERLAPSSTRAASFPLPTSGGLGGVRIEITPASGGPVFAPMLVLTPLGSYDQVTAILPSTVPAGRATVVVEVNGQRSNGEQITVVRSNFGIFTLNQGGSGPAIVQNYIADLDRPFNNLAEAARPGQVLTIWGTGLGPITTSDAQPPVPGDLGTGVEVYVGGKRANVSYGGRSGYAGIDQVNFTVPGDAPTGCYVPVYAKVNGFVSNVVSIAIVGTSGGSRVCSDDTHAFSSEITTTGQRFGSLSLSRSSSSIAAGPLTLDTRTDIATGVFQKYDFQGLIRSAGGYAISTYGACSVVTFKGESGFADPVQPTPLDPGTLTLSAPGGVTRNIPRIPQVPGAYSETLSQVSSIPIPGSGTTDFLTAGQYTVTASGGTGANAVGPFTARITLPTPLVWSNRDAISDVPRNQGLTITWTGGAPTEYVNIMGTSIITEPQTVGAAFICRERASVGSFTVPADVLSLLPPSAVIQGAPTGSLSVGSTSIPTGESRFTATGLDQGYIGYSFTSMKSVTFR